MRLICALYPVVSFRISFARHKYLLCNLQLRLNAAHWCIELTLNLCTACTSAMLPGRTMTGSLLTGRSRASLQRSCWLNDPLSGCQYAATHSLRSARSGRSQTAAITTATGTTSAQQAESHQSIKQQQGARNASYTDSTTPRQLRQRFRNRSSTQPVPKPFLIRIAGRTSDVKAASGAVVKRLRTEDMVRVAAIDSDSLLKSMITLTAANNMAQANSGQMLVFQPTAITSAAAEPPSLPEGSMVMYTTQIMQGEVLTFNTLRVSASTIPQPLSKAIIARIATSSHTVLECYGTAALTTAVRAVAQARKGLLVKGQDVACIIASTPKAAAASASAAASDAASSSSGADAQADSAGSNSSRRPPTCHRLVLLECEPRNPRALLVTSTVGVSDRALAREQSQASQKQQREQQASQ